MINMFDDVYQKEEELGKKIHNNREGQQHEEEKGQLRGGKERTLDNNRQAQQDEKRIRRKRGGEDR